MAEEAGYPLCNRISAAGYGGDNQEDDEGRFLEWERSLRGGGGLVPLSQLLISPELAAAFRINPEPSPSSLDVHRAAMHTFSSLQRAVLSSEAAALRSLRSSLPPSASSHGEPPSLKDRPADSAAAGEPSAAPPENTHYEQSGRMLKRPRVVWTPQLHKRFLDVVAHLGIRNAVPKTTMQLMNVEGLTRENVASHLQKYRLYLKRAPGQSSDGPSASDHLYASTPVPQSLREKQQKPFPVSMKMPATYAVPAVIPVPVYWNPIAMVPVDSNQVVGGFAGFEEPRAYGTDIGERPKDC